MAKNFPKHKAKISVPKFVERNECNIQEGQEIPSWIITNTRSYYFYSILY